MTPAEETLTSRIRPGSPFRENVRHLFGLKSRLDAERRKLADDLHLSDTGRREKETKFAKELVRNLADLSRPVRLAKTAAASKRESFKLPETDKADAIVELKRQEVRAYLRGLSLEDRVNAIDLLGDDATLAIIDAAPALSGLPPDRHEFIKTRYLERQFGAQMRELELAEEDTTALEAAATMVRRDLQIATGLGNSDFATLEKSHE